MRAGALCVLLLATGVLLFAGCASTIVTAAKTVTTAAELAKVASDAFVKFDAATQLKIVNEAANRMNAEASLVSYRVKQKAIADSFVVFDRALEVAKTAIVLAHATGNGAAVAPAVVELLKAADALRLALATVGLRLGG